MSPKIKNKTESSWDWLFQKYKILDEINKKHFFVIDSRQINEIRESRLMAKFDHRSNLPSLFERNKLSILPISRGSYIISDFEAYQGLSYDKSIKPIEIGFPQEIQSIDKTSIYSEAIALNCAYAAGIIDDVLEEESIPTVSGRMSTSSFDFQIKTVRNVNTNIAVKNSQCEIDGGYESQSKLALIETKNFISDDFLIRQVYYPYRLWVDKISKEVIPIFMTYSNDTFNFFIYRFTDKLNYNSLELVKQKKYIFGSDPIGLKDIENVLKRAIITREPKIPFPQADKFERVVDLLGLLMEKDLSSDEITINYDFDERQTFYYTSAGMYLGLVTKRRDNGNITYCLNDIGKSIMAKPHNQKVLSLVEKILEHDVFNKALLAYLKKASPLTREDASTLMKTCSLYNMQKESTYYRRAQTLIKWIDWILELQDA